MLGHHDFGQERSDEFEENKDEKKSYLAYWCELTVLRVRPRFLIHLFKFIYLNIGILPPGPSLRAELTYLVPFFFLLGT